MSRLSSLHPQQLPITVPLLFEKRYIILDNTSFHKGGNIREIIEEAGCEVWYLPALLTRFK
ncbi:transposase [Microcoleus sp. FACHB-672]|nr:transposase [Microcoleus sp. FACHB-672]